MRDDVLTRVTSNFGCVWPVHSRHYSSMHLPGRLLASISLCVLFHSTLFSYGQDTKQSSALNYFNFKGQSTPSHELVTILERQARWDDAGSGDMNLTGSRLNPEGLHLRFVKIDEQATPIGHGTARYRVYAEGAPDNKVYAFGSWFLTNAPTTDSRDLYVNGQGLLMLHKPKPEQELSFTAGDDEYDVTTVTDKAVPTRYLLTSRDRQLMIYGTLVPNPVVAEEQGCRLEARIAQPDASAVLIVADRFPAKAKIPLVLESSGSSSSQMLNTNTEGHGVMAVFPYLAGISQGMLKASAEGSGCLPYVVLPWGAQSQAAPVNPQPEPPKEQGPATDPKKKSLLQKLHIPGQ